MSGQCSGAEQGLGGKKEYGGITKSLVDLGSCSMVRDMKVEHEGQDCGEK